MTGDQSSTAIMQRFRQAVAEGADAIVALLNEGRRERAKAAADRIQAMRNGSSSAGDSK